MRLVVLGLAVIADLSSVGYPPQPIIFGVVFGTFADFKSSGMIMFDTLKVLLKKVKSCNAVAIWKLKLGSLEKLLKTAWGEGVPA